MKVTKHWILPIALFATSAFYHPTPYGTAIQECKQGISDALAGNEMPFTDNYVRVSDAVQGKRTITIAWLLKSGHERVEYKCTSQDGSAPKDNWTIESISPGSHTFL